MNPNQDPQQTPIVPSAPLPINSVPGVTPAQPASQPFGEPAMPSPTPAEPTPAPGFGSGIVNGSVESTPAPSIDMPKKKFSKKLLIIIGIAVAIIAAIAVILLVIKPGSANNIVSVIQSSVAPASQLTEYKGTAFTFSYPKTFKSVDASSTSTAGSESVLFSTNGQKTADGTISMAGVTATPYPTDYPRAQELTGFESTILTKVADTKTSKDVVATKTTYQSFEAFKQTGTALKDGNTLAKVTSLYVFGNKNLYVIAIVVNTADNDTIGAETDAILASLKINE